MIFEVHGNIIHCEIKKRESGYRSSASLRKKSQEFHSDNPLLAKLLDFKPAIPFLLLGHSLATEKKKSNGRKNGHCKNKKGKYHHPDDLMGSNRTVPVVHYLFCHFCSPSLIRGFLKKLFALPESYHLS